MAVQTTVLVSKETRDRLARLKYSKSFRTLDDTIVHLLEEHEEKEGNARSPPDAPA
jgi:macrodomain Ter protein organizer (MatP/YcbG family)